jgi:hypothetical protein
VFLQENVVRGPRRGKHHQDVSLNCKCNISKILIALKILRISRELCS